MTIKKKSLFSHIFTVYFAMFFATNIIAKSRENINTQQKSNAAVANPSNVEKQPKQETETSPLNTEPDTTDIEADDFDHSISNEITVEQTKKTSLEEDLPEYRSGLIKDWTFITYMAADNDLAPFARKNIRQQADIGSNARINIVTQLDTRIAGNKKVTKRYYVEKDKLIATNQNDPTTQSMDSGSPATLIDCCRWAIQGYPARNYALVLWNHGTGTIDFGRPRTINPYPLFMYNPQTNLIELDRSISFADFLSARMEVEQRGICFDDSTGHYLTNQDLEHALKTICERYLKGKKFALVCFDACLMSMVEIANIVRPYADYMTGSEEVELGTGYHYGKVLSPFLNGSMERKTFAQHVVKSYQEVYTHITGDYTQSAIELKLTSQLEAMIHEIGALLIEALQKQQSKTVYDAIKTSRHKLFCTHFDEPSYIDLHHFCTNLLNNLKTFKLKNSSGAQQFTEKLGRKLQEVLNFIPNVVVANVAGKNLRKAQGISIYFPERRMHSSYNKTNFAKTNMWSTFIKHYLTLK